MMSKIIFIFIGKVHDCVGKNRISNYAILWMLIFYLQQEEVFPTIHQFQIGVQPYLVNHYNFAFDERVKNQTTNRKRCSELLLGFFKFYKSYQFDSQVICPLYGRSFCKDDILEYKLPEFQRYHELLTMNQSLSSMQFNKCICIQDPFGNVQILNENRQAFSKQFFISEITHTIPGVIANVQFQKILLKFEYAAEIIETELEMEGQTTKLLKLLFDTEKFNQWIQQRMSKDLKKNSLQKTTILKPQTSTSARYNIIKVKPTEKHLSMIREISMKKRNSNSEKIDNLAIHRFWAELIIDGIICILRDIFMLEIDKFQTNNTKIELSKIFNMNAETSDDRRPYTEEFNIMGSHDVFLGRKQIKKITVNTFNLEKLESQERLKRSALKIQLKAATKIQTDVCNFDEVTIQFHDLIRTKRNNSFKSFVTNFGQSLNNLLKIYLVHKCDNLF